MSSIAFATYHEAPDLMPSDRSLIQPLARRGITITPAVWNDLSVEWGTFDAVVIRSMWDYHLYYGDFCAWLDRLEAMGIPILNSPKMVRWNMDKRYLKELSDAGIPTIPTIWLENDLSTDLSAILAEKGWSKAVIKPRISASAYDTWLTTPQSAAVDQTRLSAMLQRGPVMIQPFVEEIHEGELAFVFFKGIYSHTLLKRPPTDTFFVQEEYGGIITNHRPVLDLIAQASHALQTAHHLTQSTSIYARVDGIVRDGQLRLMELELIEPELYVLYANPEAAERFADAIYGAVGK